MSTRAGQPVASVGMFVVDRAGSDDRAPAPAEKSRDFNTAAHGLRGVAAMMVFFAHLLGGTADHIFAADPAFDVAIRPYWFVGTWGVPLFFVISGFVILPSVTRYSLSGFALRRFLRLYPLFFVFSVIFVILNGLTGAYPKLDTATAIVSGFLFLNLFTGTEQLTPNAWSLTFEVIFYCATALTFHFAVRRRSAPLAALAGLASLAFVVAFPMALYFVAGLLIRMLDDRGWHLAAAPARIMEVTTACAAVALASLAHHDYSWRDMTDPTVPLLMVCTAAFFYFAVHPQSLTGRLLANRATLYLGTVSYSLYIVHPYIYLPVRLLFAKLGLFAHDPWLSMAMFIATVTPMMLVATAVVHDRLERWPYARYFGQGIYRRRT